MRTPSSALPASPQGLVEGCGRPFPTAFFATDFFAFSFATFFDAALDLDLTFVLAVTFLLVAIVVPSKSSIDVANLFLANHALRVELADATALGAGRRVDHRVDQSGFAGLDRGRDGKAHADAHDAPGADVQALARLVHVDDAAGEIERVGAFVDENGIRPLFDDGAECAERAVEIHRRRILHQPRRHLGDVFVLFRLDGADPVRRRGRPLAVHALEKSQHAGADIADQRRDDLDI